MYSISYACLLLSMMNSKIVKKHALLFNFDFQRNSILFFSSSSLSLHDFKGIISSATLGWMKSGVFGLGHSSVGITTFIEHGDLASKGRNFVRVVDLGSVWDVVAKFYLEARGGNFLWGVQGAFYILWYVPKSLDFLPLTVGVIDLALSTTVELLGSRLLRKILGKIHSSVLS